MTRWGRIGDRDIDGGERERERERESDKDILGECRIFCARQVAWQLDSFGRAPQRIRLMCDFHRKQTTNTLSNYTLVRRRQEAVVGTVEDDDWTINCSHLRPRPPARPRPLVSLVDAATRCERERGRRAAIITVIRRLGLRDDRKA